MKNQSFVLFAFFLLTISSFCSCKNDKSTQSGRIQFNPQPKEATMTDTERKNAIEAKRISLAVIDTADGLRKRYSSLPQRDSGCRWRRVSEGPQIR